MKYGILLMIALSAMAEEGSQSNVAAEFGKRWSATRKLAVGVADAMPANQYAFKPDPPSMTFGEQMSHIAQINYAFCAALTESKTPALPDPTEKEALVKFVADSMDYCSSQIGRATAADMDSVHKTPDGCLNGRELLLALYVHLAHHRGQAEVYLRTKGIAPPPYVF